MIKKKIIIFGNAEMASMAHFYFTHDSSYEVVAFTIDNEYIKKDTFEGKPLIPFQNIDKVFSPMIYDMHIALSYKKMNKLREKKYNEAKTIGFTLASYICSKSVFWKDLQHGENCFILENQTLQPHIKLGNNVILWSGNHIGHKSIIGNHTYLSSHVVVSGHCKIGERCFFGVNSTLRDFTTIGNDVLVSMDASVTKNIDDGCVVISNSSEILKASDRRAVFIKNKL